MGLGWQSAGIRGALCSRRSLIPPAVHRPLSVVMHFNEMKSYTIMRRMNCKAAAEAEVGAESEAKTQTKTKDCELQTKSAALATQNV